MRLRPMKPKLLVGHCNGHKTRGATANDHPSVNSQGDPTGYNPLGTPDNVKKQWMKCQETRSNMMK